MAEGEGGERVPSPCPNCGGSDAAACECVNHGALMSFLTDFHRASGQPIPAPDQPKKRVPVPPQRGAILELGLEEDDFDYEPAPPLPVWPPTTIPAPAPPALAVGTDTGEGDRPQRRGLFRRGR